MVVSTCGSCNTLVSLDEGVIKKQSSGEIRSACCEERVFSRTDLLLPESDCMNDDDDDCWCTLQQQQYIYLPADPREAVDVCLKSNPQIMETADELLANEPRYYDAQSSDRVLYVAQKEVAHAVPSQCDVIVSDKATTCHILAVRTTSSSQSTTPLVSLTHIDGPAYETCIRDLIAQHKTHHGRSMLCGSCIDKEEEKKEDFVGCKQIEMDIHLVGGFQDVKGASSEISNFLLHLLADIASEERNVLRMTLKTCAISSMNDNGYSCPIGRGMGIDLQTGEAFLAKVHSSAAGPCQDLRSVRLWMNNGPIKQLSVIHTASSNDFVVAPFYFQRFPEINSLLTLNDELLLQCTSTSPDVEEEDFCDDVRTSLKYLLHHDCHEIFGQGQPILHRRVDRNCWKTVY